MADFGDPRLSTTGVGLGAGRALMAQAARVCIHHRGAEIVWSIYKPNLAAHDFYESLGGRYVRDLTFMYLPLGGPTRPGS